MTRHPAAHRTHARAADPDDLVVSKAVEVSEWARRNSRAVLIGIVVLAIAAVAAIYYVSYRGDMRQRAAIELLEVRQTAASGDLNAAVTQLDEFVARFDGTPAADEARLLLAQIHLLQGNASQAADAVRPVADGGEPLVSTSAGLLLAGAYEAAGQPEQAEQAYLRVAEEADLEFQQREALEDAARIRADRGDLAGAVALYDRLIQMTDEGSPDRDVYEMRRTEITTAAGS